MKTLPSPRGIAAEIEANSKFIYYLADGDNIAGDMLGRQLHINWDEDLPTEYQLYFFNEEGLPSHLQDDMYVESVEELYRVLGYIQDDLENLEDEEE